MPPALEDLILALLAKKPEQRPTSAQAVRNALKRILRELGDAATRLGPAPATRTPSVATTQPPDAFRGAGAARGTSPGASALSGPGRPGTSKLMDSAMLPDPTPQDRPQLILDTQRISRAPEETAGSRAPEAAAPVAAQAGSGRPWLVPVVGVSALAVLFIGGAYVAKIGPFAPELEAEAPGLKPIVPKPDARPPSWMGPKSGDGDRRTVSPGPPPSPVPPVTAALVASDAGSAAPVDAGLAAAASPDAAIAVAAADGGVAGSSSDAGAAAALTADASVDNDAIAAARADASVAAEGGAIAGLDSPATDDGGVNAAIAGADDHDGGSPSADVLPDEPEGDVAPLVAPASATATKRRTGSKRSASGVLQVGVVGGRIAEVFVDGAAVGVTPFEAEFAPGDHRVRVQVQDEPPWTGTVRVKAGSTARVVRRWNAQKRRLE